jgi:hypothetical protein
MKINRVNERLAVDELRDEAQAQFEAVPRNCLASGPQRKQSVTASQAKQGVAADHRALRHGQPKFTQYLLHIFPHSPPILVSEIEVQKKAKSQEKPPILPPPAKR